MATKKTDGPRVLATNRSARHEYHLLQQYEAGIVLCGTEVKSARLGKVNLKDAYARIVGNEVFLHNCHISPYEQGNRENHEPVRPRKLLLHAAEIRKISREILKSSLTMVPTRMYLKGGRVKVRAFRGRDHSASRDRSLIEVSYLLFNSLWLSRRSTIEWLIWGGLDY